MVLQDGDRYFFMDGENLKCFCFCKAGLDYVFILADTKEHMV